MKLKPLQLIVFTLVSLVTFSGCKDNNDDAEPSKTDLLVAHEWRGDQVLMMGINVSESGATQGNVPDFKTLLLTFKSDNTYTAKNDQLSFDGEWRLNEKEDKLYFDMLGELNIKNLTIDNLDLTKTVTKAELVMIATLLNVDLGVINNLPSNIPIQTEVRFVRP